MNGDGRAVRMEDIRFERACWPRGGEPDPGRIGEFVDLYDEEGPQALPPIVLVRTDEGFVIADGVHRFHAACELDLEEIPAVLLDPPDGAEPIEFAFLAAVRASTRGHRELSPVEKRRGIARLIAETSMSDEDIADVFAVSRQTVWRRRVALQPARTAIAGPGERFVAQEAAKKAAPRLLRAMEKVRETRGIGLADAVFGDRMGVRFAAVLRKEFAEEAVKRAGEYRAWIDAAISELQSDESAT